ncbi:MAG: DNA polymerase-1, partial [Glaciecola sp.]
MSDRKTLLLLDGHSLAYRAFFALPDTLATRSGQVTNAVYGFTSMLIKMWTDRRPDGIVVMFDKGRDAQRMAEYPEYKAGRAEIPDIFRTQFGLIRDVLGVLGIPIVEVPAVEADDVIATIATRAVEAGWHAYIVTGDRDAMQLADEHVTVLYNLRGITEVGEMTPAAVQEKYGIPPSSYVRYAALRGDKSDNLPGVPSVGEKTAAKLVSEFRTFDNLFANLDKIKGNKVPAMLKEYEDQARRNERIMTLRRDVDVTLDLEDVIVSRDLDLAAVREVFGALEFRALYDRFVQDVLGEVEQEQASSFAGTPTKLEGGEVAAWLKGVTGALAVLPITTGSVPHVTALAWALAAENRDPASIATRDMIAADHAAIREALTDDSVQVVTHDLKALSHVCFGLGYEPTGVSTDTMLAAYLIHPEQRSFDLERLSLQELSRSIVSEDAGKGSDQLSLGLEEDPWEERARRAQAVLALATHFSAELESRDQSALMDEIERPLAPVLARLEFVGVALDRHVLDELHERMSVRAGELESEVHALAGREFKVGSGQQLQVVLFDELGLTRTKKIKTGWSTDAAQLGNIRHEHDIVDAVLEWREVTKLLSTYVGALPPLLDAVTGRIHTTLSQTVAATGRLSSSNPNLQNIPVRRAEGREIRRAFVPGEGFDHLLVADYSQIELRIMAHLSEDEGLLEAFLSGEDIHATTAAKVFDLPLADV